MKKEFLIIKANNMDKINVTKTIEIRDYIYDSIWQLNNSDERIATDLSQ